MSTAARMTSPPTIPVLVARIGDIAREKLELERDLTSQRVRTHALERALMESHDAPKVVGMETVGGVLTVVLSDGKARQYRSLGTFDETQTRYKYAWIDIEPVPSTPAAIIAAALTIPADNGGMAVVA